MSREAPAPFCEKLTVYATPQYFDTSFLHKIYTFVILNKLRACILIELILDRLVTHVVNGVHFKKNEILYEKLNFKCFDK